MGRSRITQLEPPPRLVDWSLLVLVIGEAVSGVVSLTVGSPAGEWVFVLHSVGGLVLVVLLGWKFRRVWKRVIDRSLWDGGTPVSVLLGVTVIAALATGIYWTLSGPVRVAVWPLLLVHMVLGLLGVPLVGWHLRHRFRSVRRTDFQGRRTAIQYTAHLGVGALAWRLQESAGNALDLPGADRRFTGSKEDGSGDGNAFPVTSWVADDPDPIDPADWTLRVTGTTAQDLTLTVDDIVPDPASASAPATSASESASATTPTSAPESGVTGTDTDTADERAVLDCTSGWYSEHNWQGIRVGDLLDSAEPTAGARWVRFTSVTGYRWSLPIEEARDALLATHVDGERLSHGHGFPLRLVAPGRRGFQWVKWVTSVEVTYRRDFGQWLVIFISGFE